ncbi:molecular chaperone DnaJ [Nocardioides marmoriginsengisoli]|uniref:Chaperone protein DnaJ n=1 Tax=Nocardioides marmoriginsengisoli TaxID=661483 RepID=A0A3N0CBU8_9ACTN|nr:molecular chaperone DnaJ [Nocardioides marmoriginsengisoli]RNL60453.1 molecular chaperone DnaJ [Nocardioides marmoriginsengisoli]
MSNADWANKDFYKVLGVDKDADQGVIKKAYRKLARENHPDSKPGDSVAEDRFKQVAEAYDVVGDAGKRKEYDEMRALYAGGFGGHPNFGGQPGGNFGGQGGFDISDLLGGFFGGGGGGAPRNQRRATRGSDLETEATISFTDALDGTTISLRLSAESACETCRGTGGKPGTKPHVCPTCGGAGMVVNNMGGGFAMNETCPECHGHQVVYDEACPTCRGSGRGTSSRTIQARLPAGVKDGQRIRLKGKGAPGESGGPAGDLFVSVRVAAHPIFGRKGDSLTLTAPVSFDEAALGAQITVPVLGGTPVTLRIAPGTPTGRVLRVRGRGVTGKGGVKGDLLVTVEVQVPSELNAAAREALLAYREATSGDDPRAGLVDGS